jgi:predicted DNA-binding protein
MRYNFPMKDKSTSFRLSLEAKRLLKELSKKQGISQAAVLEILIREKAKAENIE